MTDDRPDIEAVFEHYGRRILTGRGDWAKAECPLVAHEDRNPSASVNTETGKWQCFSCDGHGDVYDILRENEGLAGFLEVQQFAKDNFASSSRAVRPGGRPSGGLPFRSASRKGARNWSPPWGGL